jgi:hypothetical protein
LKPVAEALCGVSHYSLLVKCRVTTKNSNEYVTSLV